MLKIEGNRGTIIYRAETVGDLRKLLKKANVIHRIGCDEGYDWHCETWTVEQVERMLEGILEMFDLPFDGEKESLHLIETWIYSAHARVLDENIVLEIFDLDGAKTIAPVSDGGLPF